MFVEDLARAKPFYQDVFDLAITFEDEESAVFSFENTMINLLKASAAGELIEPGVVAERSSGSRFQLTMWVDQVDTVCAELASKGVTLLNGPMVGPGVSARPASPIRTGTFGSWRRREPSSHSARRCMAGMAVQPGSSGGSPMGLGNGYNPDA